MYRIYFEKRTMCISSDCERMRHDSNGVIYYPGDIMNMTSIAEFFDRSKEINTLYIPTEDEEATFKQICSSFKIINAGGGVVTNKRGDVLMIYRNDVWDLPKGKQEPNEDIRNTALREVEEECGVTDLELRELITITNHTYHLNGNFILKRTYWYRMHYEKPAELTPQLEENISKAVWVSKSALPLHLKDTYPSIIEVFKKLSKVGNDNIVK